VSAVDGTESAAPRDRIAVVAAVGLVVAIYSHYYDRYQLPPRLPGSVGLIVGGDVVPLLLVPVLVVWFGLRDRLGRYGWRWPGARAFATNSVLAYAAMLPIVLWLSQRPEFQAFYPSPAFPPARQHLVGLAFLWLLHHGPQLFATEFCFRGFLLQPLGRQLGIARAIAVTTAPYVVLHLAKPPLELLLASWGGVVFGIVAWRTRSFLPAFAAHWAIAMTMDWLCYQHLAR
jgi:membrane protease YdiL (CAAX protease family)